ncbi:MAG: hypothetical protein IK089_05995 [Oxalobacter sp.]|nr:hypothetical protein [Oxalobacter sp.]
MDDALDGREDSGMVGVETLGWHRWQEKDFAGVSLNNRGMSAQEISFSLSTRASDI